MAIRFNCGHCNATYSVADKFAGQAAKCKKCEQKVQIPALPEAVGNALIDAAGNVPGVPSRVAVADESRAEAALVVAIPIAAGPAHTAAAPAKVSKCVSVRLCERSATGSRGWCMSSIAWTSGWPRQPAPTMLVPVEQLVQHKTAALEANLAMRRLFGNHLSVPSHMVFQVVFEASADAKDGFETLHSHLLSDRTAMIKLLPEYATRSKAFDELDSRWLTCHFPFEHADGRLSLSQYMLPKLPAKGDVVEVRGGAEKFVENYHYVYFRSIGALAHICQRIEEALGFEPQPVPPHEEKLSEEQAAVGL